MKLNRCRLRLASMLFGCAAWLAGGTALALEVGDKAPNFALAASTAKEIKLSDFAGKRNVVLFFFVGAFTDT